MTSMHIGLTIFNIIFSHNLTLTIQSLYNFFSVGPPLRDERGPQQNGGSALLRVRDNWQRRAHGVADNSAVPRSGKDALGSDDKHAGYQSVGQGQGKQNNLA